MTPSEVASFPLQLFMLRSFQQLLMWNLLGDLRQLCGGLVWCGKPGFMSPSMVPWPLRTVALLPELFISLGYTSKFLSFFLHVTHLWALASLDSLLWPQLQFLCDLLKMWPENQMWTEPNVEGWSDSSDRTETGRLFPFCKVLTIYECSLKLQLL